MSKHIPDININDMEESKDYLHCPYCGTTEPDIPGYKEAQEELEKYKGSDQYWDKHQELFQDIPIHQYYEVNGKLYPFDANMQYFNDAYAKCHYGVTYWWNEIHCCPHCQKEYFTIHEH